MSLKDLQSLITTPQMGADAIMKCALGVRTTEMEAYCTLVTGGPATVQDVAERLGKSRPTAQRLLQNLVDKGLASREERLIGLGGYQYIYSPVPPEAMKVAVRETLDRWYRRMLNELDDLPSKLDEMGLRCQRRAGSQSAARARGLQN
ncbi:MAG: helix-turn-helix domain-containing protein [Candidatus Bathyarchaeota archaeon]|nr:MAG: helix-turn-helix domain-containing protein [Candidatus Bathyarchaeota archaeon]